MAARSDILGAIGTAVFGAVVGFAATAMFLWPPWEQVTTYMRGRAGKGARALDASVPVESAADPGSASAADGAVAVGPGDGGADAAALTAVQAVQAVQAAPARTYNVLLISVDTLRHDLGFVGYPKPITPNIDTLAARSTVFERAYSMASFTPKSLGPLMIGRYSSETLRDYEHYTTFHSGNVFLAERAKAAGVRTFAGMCHRYFTFNSGFKQGFDAFDTSAMPPAMTDNDTRTTSAQLTRVAIDMLSKPVNVGGSSRFFAWFHYFDPHAPYVTHAGAPRSQTAERTSAARQRAIYDEEVWFTDSHIGRLLAFVFAQPWAADTAIILTADHGEAFGEHGHWKHGREVWEPLVRVPLIVYLPGRAPKHVATKRSHIDLAPTVVELLGAGDGRDHSLRGRSLVADVLAPPGAPLEERDVYIDMPEGPFNEMRRAIISGPSPGTKLVDAAGKRFELYDLATDPNETTNLAGDAARLRASLVRLGTLRSTLDEIPPTPR